MDTNEEEKKAPLIEVTPYSVEKGEVKPKRGRKAVFEPAIRDQFPEFDEEQTQQVKRQIESILASRRQKRGKQVDENKERVRAAAMQVLDGIDKSRVKPSPLPEKNIKNESPAPPNKKQRRYVEI